MKLKSTDLIVNVLQIHFTFSKISSREKKKNHIMNSLYLKEQWPCVSHNALVMSGTGQARSPKPGATSPTHKRIPSLSNDS